MTSGQGRYHLLLSLLESCWLDCLLFDSWHGWLLFVCLVACLLAVCCLFFGLPGCLLDWPVGVVGCWLVVIGWVGRCMLAWLVCGCWLAWLLVPGLIDSWLGGMLLVGCLLNWLVGVVGCWSVVIGWAGRCMLA